MQPIRSAATPGNLMTCTFMSITWAFLIILVILSTIGYSMTKTGKEFITDITKNWNTGAIMDLTVTTSPNCPASYEEAYNYTWPGTSVGCSCKNSFFFYKYLLYAETTFGYCSTRQLAMGCSNVFPTSKKILSNWGTIQNKPTKICLKRSSETWFANAPLTP